MNIDTAALELKAERDKVLHQLAELGADEQGELTGDVDYGEGFADAAAATAERTEVLGIVENLMKALNDVDAALKHVAAGTYGICEVCGNEISPARLEFRPTSTRCVDCKAQSE